MRIAKTNDSSYPIKFDDSWFGVAYMHRSVVFNDEEFETFIRNLREIRAGIIKEKEGIKK